MGTQTLSFYRDDDGGSRSKKGEDNIWRENKHLGVFIK